MPITQDGATSLVVAKEGEAGAAGASQEQQAAPEAEAENEDEEEVTARVLDKLMEIAIRYPMVRPRSHCVCADFCHFRHLRAQLGREDLQIDR